MQEMFQLNLLVALCFTLLHMMADNGVTKVSCAIVLSTSLACATFLKAWGV